MEPAESDRVRRLRCCSGPIEIEPLGGGLTNRSFLVRDPRGRFVVRLGEDLPVHGIDRGWELAASVAAFRAGLAPEVVHHERGEGGAPSALVLRYVDGRPLTPQALREPVMLRRVVERVVRCHRELQRHLDPAAAAEFQAFAVIRGYADALHAARSRWTAGLARHLGLAAELAAAAGTRAEALCHNDLLGANFLDDGARLWLIDWEYSGFGDPFFDLGGLAANNGLAEAEERLLLAGYLGAEATAAQWREFRAMKCAALLREALWGMVSEVHSRLPFDYGAYAQENLLRFERAFGDFKGP